MSNKRTAKKKQIKRNKKRINRRTKKRGGLRSFFQKTKNKHKYEFKSEKTDRQTKKIN